MFYRGNQHRQLFDSTMEKQRYCRPTTLAAIYLLAADSRLWSQAKRLVSCNSIMFGQFRLTDASPACYTLCAVARDLYSGTRKLYIEDVTSTDVVLSGIFNAICNALVICRYGIEAIPVAVGRR